MLQSEQIIAARALLEWSQADFAEHSGIGLATIKRIEAKAGTIEVSDTTLAAIYRAFEFKNVEFINDPGVGVIRHPADADFGIVTDPRAPGGVRRAYARRDVR
ncbi:helix-turn-helix domain-containing protein [Nitrospirillum amazonense]|uniref:helix-turn-helix domain-containing protein n=1 Tax=Nitrospirillum amazonense TaxID=28077 RepID=UPI00241273ED|nr:helix-turn-helix transcriptional regulator [Nitrospirillum amazonense]MDG3444609.1 helix-turn-helix transcriptional regulator [Nitrospirillum amazonense]